MTRWLLLAFRKQNLITAHISLLRNNNFLFFLPSCGSSPYRPYSFVSGSDRRAQLRSCLNTVYHGFFWQKNTCFLHASQQFFVRPFRNRQQRSKQRKTGLVVCWKCHVSSPRPSSLFLALIHLHQRQDGISDSHRGSLDQYSALRSVCCGSVSVETKGQGGDAAGSTVSLPQSDRNKQPDVVLF